MERLRRTRDPVWPAEASESVNVKKSEHRTQDGLLVQKGSSLLDSLRARSRTRCRMKDAPDGPSWVVETEAKDLQQRALELLKGPQYDEGPV